MNRNQSHQADMEFVDIPGTSIRASRVALGTWAIGGWMWGGSNESDAINAIQAALDRGINLIDTAPVYGFGRSEEIVGKALAADGRRKRAYIATKVGLDWKDGKPFRNASKARIINVAEDSLRRLQNDVMDLCAAQMDEFRKVAPLHAAQPPYNLFERAIEDDVLPYCRERDIALLAY